MYAIEQMSLQGMNSINMGKNSLSETNDLSSQSGLVKEYQKLSIQLKQLQVMEKRTSKQVMDLRREETETLGEIQKFSSLEVIPNLPFPRELTY